MKILTSHFLRAILPMFLLYTTPSFALEKIRHGSLDVSTIAEDKIEDLEGDWFVVKDRLLGPQEIIKLDFSNLALETVNFKNIFDIRPDQPLQKTFILKLTGLQSAKQWAISSAMILNSMRVMVVDMDGAGTILYDQGLMPDSGGPLPSVIFCCRVGSVPKINGEAYLVIQVAVKKVSDTLNFSADLLQPPQIGRNQLQFDQDRLHTYEIFFSVGLYFLLSLNSLGLFLQRREDKASLLLAIFGFGLILRYASTEGIIYRLFGAGLTWDAFFNISVLFAGPSVIMICLIQFIHLTFHNLFPNILRKTLLALLSLSLLPPLFFDGPLLLSNWIPVGVVHMLAGLSCCWVYIMASLKREEGAQLGLLGIGIMAVTHINDVMVGTHVYQFNYLGHFGLAGMMFSQALIIGKRFASTYQKSKILGEELAIKNLALEQQKNEIIQLNNNLQEYNAQLEYRVEEKTRDIKSILRSIRQGILLIDRADGTIGDQYSEHLKRMLQTEQIAGKNIIDLCFMQSNLSKDELDQLYNGLAVILHENEIGFEMNASSLPAELIRDWQGSKQILELDWNPVIDGHVVDKLLLVLRDVTEIRNLQGIADRQQVELQLIAQIINIPNDRFNSVIRSIERLLETSQILISSSANLDISAIDLLYRNMHTVKGITRSYQLRELTDKIHLSEEKYKDLRNGKTHPRENLTLDIQEICEYIQNIKLINNEKLGRQSINEDRFILVDKIQIEENLSNIREIDINNLTKGDRGRVESIKDLFKKIVFTPLHKVIEGPIQSLQTLAASLQKEPPLLNIADPGISLNRDVHELLNNVFSHLLRNAIDHGLETTEERLKAGKNSQGCIKLELSINQDLLRILMSDDGRGINLLSLKEKAIAKGLVGEEQEICAIDLANLILQAGFSTATRVTDISGRGVGLDAASKFLEEQGGSLEIILDKPHSYQLNTVPLSFLISLPSTCFQVVA